MHVWSAAALCGLLMTVASPALAQTNVQLWGNFTVNWVKSARLVYEVDVEPKGLLKVPAGEADWRNVDVTPNVEFSPRGWLDLVGDLTTGYTKQTDDLNSFELTPRLGVRLHLFSRDLPAALHGREQPPTRRIVVRDLVRVEYRTLFYTGEGSGSESTVRFRNRLEFLLSLNKPKMTDDGARYLLADWEWFIPREDLEERFANKQRIRAGFGYRRSFAWRFEVLYMWTRSRDTAGEGFTTSDHIIDIRVKRVF